MKCNDFEKSKSRHMNLDKLDKALQDLRALTAINEARREYLHTSKSNLDNVDKALQELGMLSAITEARREYLRESESNYSVMRLNTRYVSNVTVGYCMKRATTKNRLCPYMLPIRHRTKSENSDAIGSDVSESACEYKNSLLEPSTSGYNIDSTKSPAKRCQSLENLNLSQSLENLNLSVEASAGAETSPDMDCVSTRIQKLQVDE